LYIFTIQVLHKNKGYRQYFIQLRGLLGYKHVGYVGNVMNIVRPSFIYCPVIKFVQTISFTPFV